jgi:hypothetical protein
VAKKLAVGRRKRAMEGKAIASKRELVDAGKKPPRRKVSRKPE